MSLQGYTEEYIIDLFYKNRKDLNILASDYIFCHKLVTYDDYEEFWYVLAEFLRSKNFVNPDSIFKYEYRSEWIHEVYGIKYPHTKRISEYWKLKFDEDFMLFLIENKNKYKELIYCIDLDYRSNSVNNHFDLLQDILNIGSSLGIRKLSYEIFRYLNKNVSFIYLNKFKKYTESVITKTRFSGDEFEETTLYDSIKRYVSDPNNDPRSQIDLHRIVRNFLVENYDLFEIIRKENGRLF